MNEKSEKSRRRPNDPGRRDRIISAALLTIARLGVSDTNHRSIAEEAGVPLGSLTYYFSGLDEIFGEAFSKFAKSVSGRLYEVLSNARNREEAKIAVVDFLADETEHKEQEMVLSFELYAYASRRTFFKGIMLEWLEASRRALELHFTPAEARSIDAIIEGVTIHNATSPHLISRDEMQDMIDKLA
ncbi:TetR/AcrR family transcriptional regulator [Rhizobium sp. HT1-10]|uniref:TetR/AcrR family transcriptional regulator n=1 Tax=Rhizobium sp. HT1-10 TaxID=3111638 RepID=UPI003C21137B